ncbi:hypothetical protein CTAYLR_005604 [Chrysophaeum taylorii]|uniref:Uncharacterized protein n=1 Tax=Chrysophaeum taylorii TaxID=2483200 RepID=A0AAD7XIQ0_9STRA|nr:hypothetical protein CTAYLR_005604 [Chrysophaeum taylorii]
MVVAVAAQHPSDALWDPSWEPSFGEQTILQKSAVSAPECILYSSWFCPFAQRGWIACEECEVKYKWVEINPYETDPAMPGGYTKKQLPIETKKKLYPEFVAASPKGLVPALAVGPEKLAESQPIIEYVDGKFAPGRLLPTDPYKRAYARIWADYADARIQRPYYRVLIEQDPEARERAFADLLQGCRDFAKAMDPVGPFFLAEFSYVDVSFFPFWHRIRTVGEHYRGVELPDDDPDFRRLDAWWTACKARPSIKRTLVCEPRLVASYLGYASNTATSDYAKSIQASLSTATRASSALEKSGRFAAPQTTTLVAVAFVLGLALGLLRK